MTRFIAWRIAQLPLILAVIYVITFALVWIAPGSPYENPDRPLSEAAKADLKTRFHAQSWEQFLGYYPWQIVRHGDFGPSLSYEGWTVNDILASALPVSMSLGLVAIWIALIFGSAAGVTAALRRGGLLDLTSLAIALVGVSLPAFVVAGLLIAVFSEWLHWFPSGGWGGIAPDGAAGAGAVADADGVHRAAHARFHAGHAGQRFHPHRAGQGIATITPSSGSTLFATRFCRCSPISARRPRTP